MLTNLTFGLLIGKEKGIIMLSFLNFIVDPILKTAVVDVLDTSRTHAEADQGII